MATTYTTTDSVVDQLRRNVRMKIDQAEPSGTNNIDVSFAGIDTQRSAAESEITLNLSRFYSVPLTLTSRSTITILASMATDLACYKVWLVVNPGMTRDDVPASVLAWKKNYDDMMEKIVPKGRSTAQQGRDIILEGESTIAGAGTAGTAAIALTRFLPFGGSVS